MHFTIFLYNVLKIANHYKNRLQESLCCQSKRETNRCDLMNKNDSRIHESSKLNNLRRLADDTPSLARLIISGEWSCQQDDAKQVLEGVIKAWPRESKVNFFITGGGFIDFPWPEILSFKKFDNYHAAPEVIQALYNTAESTIHKILDRRTRSALSDRTDYITLGLDSSNEQGYSAELVALINLNNGSIHWTGKSYPNSNQERSLIRIHDLSTHFTNTKHGKLMILGCHDLKMFSNRGRAKSKSEWRINALKEIDRLLLTEKPTIVLQHPHTTDSIRSWGTEIKQLCYQGSSIESFLSSGRYHNWGDPPRSSLTDILQATKIGSTIDFVYESDKNW